jgi:hypothetical protein
MQSLRVYIRFDPYFNFTAHGGQYKTNIVFSSTEFRAKASILCASNSYSKEGKEFPYLGYYSLGCAPGERDVRY